MKPNHSLHPGPATAGVVSPACASGSIVTHRAYNTCTMSSRILYSDRINVHYGQFYVEPVEGDFVSMDMAQAFAGQSNGICGAARAGRLFLITGIHTASVHVTIEHLDAKPPVDDTWEEIVECSFTHNASTLVLREWAAEAEYQLSIQPGTYRVRYCAKCMLADWQ